MRNRVSKFVLATLMAMFVISSSFQVQAQSETGTLKTVPSNSSFKAYMSYTAITNETSKQYALQKLCTTDSNGLRRYDSYYVIAMGTYYSKTVGTRVDITLDTGVVLKCVIGDVKQDKHTDATNRQAVGNGNVVEFIVDTSELPTEAANAGDISKIDGFAGAIKTIEVYETVSDFDVTDTTPDKGMIAFTVIGKHTMEISGKTVYILEFSTTTDFTTIAVKQDEYADAIINKTTVFYDKETHSYNIK